MDRIFVPPGAEIDAAFEGRQLFMGGGPGSLVRMNGNPADYRLECNDDDGKCEGLSGYVLTALNGSGEYRFDATIDRIGFVSGAYSVLGNLKEVIDGGDRSKPRLVTAQQFVSHAQIREDVLLMRSLRDVPPEDGFYIDVGAYDPDRDSITRAFYDMGWRGINLEPSAVLHSNLQRSRPRDINLCCAASSKDGVVTFFENDGEQLGTLEKRFADERAREVAVPAVRLADVCREHASGEIHFLKVDVEGHERDVLEGCDFETFRPWIVVMEAVAPNRADVATYGEWQDILFDAGYDLVGEDELNRYYLASERSEKTPFFRLPVDNYISGSEMAERNRLSHLLDEANERVEALEDALQPGLARSLRRLLRTWRTGTGV